MGHKIKFMPSGRLCEGEVGESILAASLRVGLNPVYGCSNGNCGACRAKLISGEIEPMRHHDFGLTSAEKTSGHFLMCANRALIDIEVQADVTQGPDDIPLQDIETKVRAIEYLDSQVIKLHLQTPRSHRLRFISGQSVTLTFRDDFQMSLPIASCPCDDRNIHFHVPDIPGDAFSEKVFSGQLAPRDNVRLQGPKPGKFYLDDTETRQSLILCWHTGFAPIASLIEHAMSLEIEADIFLHRFSPTPDRQYLSNLCRSWSDAFDNIHTEMMPDRVTLLTNEAECAQILRPIAARYPDLSNFNIYLSGPPNFVSAAKNMFAEQGVHASQLKTHIDDLVALD